MSRHDLVVGGTGMLRAVVEHLLGDGSRLTVLARGRHGFGGLVDSPSAATGMLQCVVVDYTDDVAFAGALRAAIAERGAPARAVAWIHDDTAPRALGILADALASSDWERDALGGRGERRRVTQRGGGEAPRRNLLSAP